MKKLSGFLIILAIFLIAATPISNESKLIDRTTTALGSNGTYNSPVVLTFSYTRIKGIAFADQASATDGLKIQQSTDADCNTNTPANVNWDYESTFSVTASTGLAFSVELVGRCARVQYVNGGTGQGTFRLASWLRTQ